MFGVPGLLEVFASAVRNGDRAGATTDSRSKYDPPSFSGVGIMICGGLGRTSSVLWL